MNKFIKAIPWVLAAFIAFAVFIPSLFFKFSAAAESVHIFEVVGEWLGMSFFEPYGRIAIGAAELVASLLLLIPATQVFGAILGLGIMSGAITFHLFSPLGITVRWMENGAPQEDGSLFFLAVLTFISCIVIIWMRRDRLRFDRLKPMVTQLS